MASDTTKVDLPTARVYKGVAYGPGEGVEIPREVAEAFSLESEERPTLAAAKKKARGRK